MNMIRESVDDPFRNVSLLCRGEISSNTGGPDEAAANLVAAAKDATLAHAHKVGIDHRHLNAELIKRTSGRVDQTATMQLAWRISWRKPGRIRDLTARKRELSPHEKTVIDQSS